MATDAATDEDCCFNLINESESGRVFDSAQYAKFNRQ